MCVKVGYVVVVVGVWIRGLGLYSVNEGPHKKCIVYFYLFMCELCLLVCQVLQVHPSLLSGHRRDPTITIKHMLKMFPWNKEVLL